MKMKKLLSLYCLYEVNSWVAATFGKTWYPEQVKSSFVYGKDL